VKTIAFSATVAHGEELCRQFNEAGFNFQQISYKDGTTKSGAALIEEFRQARLRDHGPGVVRGVSQRASTCRTSVRDRGEALSKVFSSHIQQLGRVMRPCEGKTFALWLDHSGNFLRFLPDTQEVFALGVADLDSRDYDTKVRKEPEEKEKKKNTCGACHYLMGNSVHCPACGWERPKQRNEVKEIDGTLQEVVINGKATKLPTWANDRDAVWRQLCYHALDRKKGEAEAARKFALAQYRNIYGDWPKSEFSELHIEPPHPALVNKVKSLMIAWAKRRAA
jgi:DNA repair protein RadD